jgi:hypothetical protein
MRPEITHYKDYAFRIAKLYGTILKKDALPMEDYQAIMQFQDGYQRTILHYLSMHGAVKAIMSAVKTLKANTEAKDFEGNTPLHYGAMHYSSGTLFWLSAKGANPKIKNNIGKTYRDIVNEVSVRSIGNFASFLRDIVINPTGLPSESISVERLANESEEDLVIRYLMQNIIKYLPHEQQVIIAERLPSETKEDWIIRSLALNVISHREDFTDEEVKIAMVNAREVANGNEFPPLQIAAELGYVAWVKALIKAGANPERVPEKIEYKSNVRADVRTEINKIIADEKVAFALKEKTILDQYIRESSLEAERNRAVTAVSITVTAPGGSPFSTAARCTTDSNPADVACVPQQLFAGLNPLTTSLVKG